MRPRVTANLFGIAMGFAGLAQSWAVAQKGEVVGSGPVFVDWCLALASWLVVRRGYLANVVQRRGLTRDLEVPVFGPFTCLALLVPMTIGVWLADIEPTLGRVPFWVSLVSAVG